MDDKLIKELKESIDEVVFFIKGGPHPKAKKLRRTSYVFLTMPDPTSVSTMIGISLFTASKILEKHRVKGVKDYMEEYSIRVREALEIVKEFRYKKLVLD